MLNGKDAVFNDATATDRPAVLAVALVLSAVAGLALLWSSDKDELLSSHIAAEMSDSDAARVQTLLRAF